MTDAAIDSQSGCEDTGVPSAGQPAPGAAEECRRRFLERAIERLDRSIAGLQRDGDRYVRLRVSLFFGGAALATAFFVGGRPGLGWISLGVFGAAFTVAGFAHGRSKTALRRRRLWRGIKSGHLARIRLDWTAMPGESSARSGEDHPFDADLDVSGPRSLHRAIDAGVSEGGSQVLLDWLLAVRPDERTIRDRQALVRELTPLTLFRDKLSLKAELSPGWDGARLSEEALLDWLARETRPEPLRRGLLVSCLMIAATALLFALWLAGAAPPYFLLAALACAGFLLTQQSTVEGLFGDGLKLEKSLRGHQAIFRHLEDFDHGGRPLLRSLCQAFQEEGARPSRRLSRVARLVSALSVRAYFPAWIALNLALPWDFFFALRLQREKEELAELLPAWLRAWFECEAANSLANLAWLHPGWATPELDLSEPGLAAQALGHPLIPGPARVCNDFSLRGLGKTVIVTGSNMAGKSTFLRTVGLNLCLAQAGGPVCARRFRWSPVRIRSCIRVSDSLSDGFSYFYAEVRRLRLILEELQAGDPIPVLFLIDEIFKGTNNRERLIGSRSYIRALSSRNGLGLVSTHDLELAGLAEEIDAVENRHFREEVVAGRMQFDYRLRPGPCPTTNALKIMKMQGLPVDDHEDSRPGPAEPEA